MANTPNRQPLKELAQALYKEDSKRIPTELLPLMVVFGLIAIFQNIMYRLQKIK